MRATCGTRQKGGEAMRMRRRLIFVSTLLLSLLMSPSSFSQNSAGNLLTFEEAQNLYPADLSKYNPAGKILVKLSDDKIGYEISDSAPGSPGIRLVWPPKNQMTSERNIIRVAGSSSVGASVAINSVSAKVFPSGAFVGMVSLRVGDNPIKIRAEKDGAVSEYEFNVIRSRPPWAIGSPLKPLSIDETWTNKKDFIFLSSGEKISIKMKGSPRKKAALKIGESGKKIAMREMDPGEEGNVWGISGIYSVNYSPSPDDEITSAPLIFYLSEQGSNASISFKSDIILSVKPKFKPLVAQVVSPVGYARVYSKINKGVFYKLNTGIRFNVARIEKNSAKIKTLTNNSYYVKTEDIRLIDTVSTPTLVEFNPTVVSEDAPDTFTIKFSINEPIPYFISMQNEKPEIKIVWFGDRIKFRGDMPSADLSIAAAGAQILRSAAAPASVSEYNTAPLIIKWNGDYNWGVSASYLGSSFNLKIKKSPPLKDGEMFKGLRVCVDPGHGGYLAGAVGCLGAEEREVNLKIAGYLADKLKTAGADVLLTRTGDEHLSLDDRFTMAENFNPHILISVHNNSIGAEDSADEISGITTFYYNPNSKPLAEAINKQTKNILIKNRGARWENFMLTRPHEFLSVLVECAFISNPLDERLLISEKFQEEVADKIFLGVSDFLTAVKNGNKK